MIRLGRAWKVILPLSALSFAHRMFQIIKNFSRVYSLSMFRFSAFLSKSFPSFRLLTIRRFSDGVFISPRVRPRSSSKMTPLFGVKVMRYSISEDSSVQWTHLEIPLWVRYIYQSDRINPMRSYCLLHENEVLQSDYSANMGSSAKRKHKNWCAHWNVGCLELCENWRIVVQLIEHAPDCHWFIAFCGLYYCIPHLCSLFSVLK